MSDSHKQKLPHTISYRAKIAFGFALVAVISTIVGLVTFSVVWDNTCKDYAMDRLNGTAEFLSDQISENYAISGKLDASSLIPAIHFDGPEQGIGLRVYDNKDTLIYDSSNRLFEFDVKNTHQNKNRTLSQELSDSDTQRISEDIECNGEKIGTLTLWTYGNDSFLSKQDYEFRQNVFMSILLAGVLMLAISVIASLILSLEQALRATTS